MEQIEAFINSRMTDMSFQPKNNNTLPKQIKQSNFYSTASTTPTDIFCNWTNNSQHRIYQTSLIIHLYFNSHFTKKFILKKKLYTFICISLPSQKNIEKKTNPLQIMEIPCILSELSILLLLLYKCVYCT